MTTKIHLPLQYYGFKVLKLLEQSASRPHPATFLHKEEIRSDLFMLESLLRLLSKINIVKPRDKKTKDRLKATKKQEDAMGKLDDYYQIVGLFSKNKKIKKKQLDYLRDKHAEIAHQITKDLRKKNFYIDIFDNLVADPGINFNNTSLITKLKKEIEKEMQKCFGFYNKYPDRFSDMESQVHEIRRKLRWISIYGHSFNGIIVLHETKTKYVWEKKFITKTETSSSYNILPVEKGFVRYIKFNKKAFLALSFVIAKLGEIKDKAFQAKELEKSVIATKKNKTKVASVVTRQLNYRYNEKDLLAEAHDLLSEFFDKYRIHELLMLKS
jgi:hypothetical protein